MVVELILLTIAAEAMAIYGLNAWFRYTDMINELNRKDH